jgi:ribosome biogenesis ATPase
MLRPGRLESLLYVELPKPDERVKILRALLAKTSHDQGLAEVARREEGEGSCKHLSGADLSALLRKACQNALRMDKNCVEMEDMVLAANHVKPSVGDARRYEKLRERFETKMW